MAGPYSATASPNYVGAARQAARATGVVPTVFAAYVPTVDLDHGQNINPVMEAGGDGVASFAEKVAHLATGRFTVLGRPSTLGKLTAWHLGDDTVTGAGPYSHAEVADWVTDYASVEQNLADEGIERFVDSVIAEAVFTASAEAPALRATFGWACAGDPAFIAAPTAESYDAEDVFLMSDATWTVDGGAVTDVRAFTVTSRMVYDIVQLANVTADWAVKVRQEVELELTTLVEDIDTYYRKVQYGTTSGVAVTADASTGSFIADFAYGAGAAARELKLQIDSLVYNEATYTPLATEEAVKLTRRGTGLRSAGNALLEVLAKTNDSAQYDA